MHSTHWLIRKPSNARRFRLYCFSYAGGSAISYMPWQDALDPAIEVCAVQLPGRGVRMAETPYTSMSALVEVLAQVMARQDKMPFAFFGHSLGALLAYELAHHCKRAHLPQPAHLIVSGTVAPQHRKPPRRMHDWPDDELIAELKKLNGTPKEILENRELMSLVLPTIRGDFALVDGFSHRVGLPLDIPLTALAGRQDIGRDDPVHVDAWKEETTKACHVHWIDGDHFFVNSHRSEVVAVVAKTLAPLIATLHR